MTPRFIFAFAAEFRHYAIVAYAISLLPFSVFIAASPLLPLRRRFISLPPCFFATLFFARFSSCLRFASFLSRDDAIAAAIDTPLRHYCLLRRRPPRCRFSLYADFIFSAISSCRFRQAAIACHFRLLTYFHLMPRFSCLLAAAAIDSCFAAILLPAMTPRRHAVADAYAAIAAMLALLRFRFHCCAPRALR
jgi:hypothetical protein